MGYAPNENKLRPADNISNPFSRESLDAVALGPFAKPQLQTLGAIGSPGPDEGSVPEPQLAQALGFTPEELQRQLDHAPEFAEALELPQAETLRQYLQGNQRYDRETLNQLVMDLTAEVSKARTQGPSGARTALPQMITHQGVLDQATTQPPSDDPDTGLAARVPDTGPWWLK